MRLPALLLSLLLLVISCAEKSTPEEKKKVIREQKAHGFARYSWQMDSIYKRAGLANSVNSMAWKAAISPHDDYSYAAPLYYESLKGINAPVIILIGVAHRARNYNLQDQLIFGNYTHWESPYGEIGVSPVNEEIMNRLPADAFVVHDSMQQLEHSLEAIVPWIQKKNRTAQIVPILVPYINYETIDSISEVLAKAVSGILEEKDWEFGKDVAVVISNDAVHYGNVDWGNSKNMAPFGTDSTGTMAAREMDMEIINSCLTGELEDDKIEQFTRYTVQESDYKEYKWVWCGRYSVPFGLAFANKLNLLEHGEPLVGTFLGYLSSIDHSLIPVDDLDMEVTAIANNHHWVAYTGIRYE